MVWMNVRDTRELEHRVDETSGERFHGPGLDRLRARVILTDLNAGSP